MTFSVEPWYGVRCIFRHGASRRTKGYLYEERVLLVHADSFDEAIEKAEAEAAGYCQNLGDCEYLGSANAFHIGAEIIEDLTEVYSLMRDSELEADQYVSHFFDTGDERIR